MTERTRIQLAVGLAALLALATAWYGHYLVHSEAYLVVHDRTGDQQLPGASWFPNAAETSALAKDIDEKGREAFHRALDLDGVFAGFVLLFMLSVAHLGWQRSNARRWACVLVATALGAAASDWTENWLLQHAFAQGAPTEWANWAAIATTAKWTLMYASSALALLVLFFTFGSARDWVKALFIDVPYLIDSAARRADFRVHREYDYTDAGELSIRAFWKRPSFWFFVIMVGFLSYGPTPDGLCTVLLAGGAVWLLGIGGALLLVVALPLAIYWFWKGIRDRMRRRAGREGAAVASTARWPMVWAAMVPCAVVLLAPVWAAGIAMLLSATGDPCSGAEVFGSSVWRLALCVIAVAAFALVCSTTDKTSWLLWVQAGIVTALAALQWFGLADANTEASNLPYRHLFTAVIFLMCFMLCFAPAIARRRFHQVKTDSGDALQKRLAQVELFNRDRSEPKLSSGDILHAMVQGTLYRPLQLLLPPSLLALVAPAYWLELLVVVGFAVSLLLLTWGSISTRWQQLVIQVQRWLMSGLAFPVSLFVIAIGILRVMGVQYVSTILDAAPFGAVFSVVMMSYVLSWLVEYWINRTAASELLGMLGAEDDRISVAYRPTFKRDPNITVDLPGRYLMSHGIGRILLVGKLVQEPASPTTSPKKPDAGFHSYNLLGVFSALTKETDRPLLLKIVRSTNLYFYSMNLLVILVILAFALTYLAWGGAESAKAVVEASAKADGSHLKDLAAGLIATHDNTRPAVVVAASGGGTRAALYTAHVLQGLHGIGADRDIVLLSGVSGGAVALTYFAANYDLLTKETGPKAWDEFRDKVSKQFIQDVIEGAAEWRIFGDTPLTSLLAESFERRLLPIPKGQAAPRTFALSEGPPLILNTAIVGHPIEDSEVLLRALNPPKATPGEAPRDCREQQRPYNVMNGGRLIFTDLKGIEAFPGNTSSAKPKSEIPDVRLPYRIVRDPSVPLASAAALSANFPPAFQNAKVTIKRLQDDPDCPDRVYFVTDGGAEENLGLVSALFAIQSALEQIETRCTDAKICAKNLRPIHIVLAEASAAAFDYEQDRGISAAVGGAKERMTGGLTNELIQNIRRLQIRIGGKGHAAQSLRFHYLPLPLAFRARGGFGTHWMQADRIELSDPRLRTAPALWERIATRLTHGSVALTKSELCVVWNELHSPDGAFCRADRPYTGSNSDEVHRWICGARGDKRSPRDLHVEAWQSLVSELKTGATQSSGYSCARGRS